DVHVHVDPLQGGKVEARHLKTPYTPGRRAARPAWLASISAGPICAVTTLPGWPGLWHRLRCGAATPGSRGRPAVDAGTGPYRTRQHHRVHPVAGPRAGTRLRRLSRAVALVGDRPRRLLAGG